MRGPADGCPGARADHDELLRIGAVNTEALAKLYQAAFGMQEVNRIQVGGGPEIVIDRIERPTEN